MFEWTEPGPAETGVLGIREIFPKSPQFSREFKYELVWKKKAKEESGKKRSRAQPLALNPNLLFEREEEEELEGGDERERIHSEVSSSNDRELDHKKEILSHNFCVCW